jgi:hypothetical protein
MYATACLIYITHQYHEYKYAVGGKYGVPLAEISALLESAGILKSLQATLLAPGRVYRQSASSHL